MSTMRRVEPTADQWARTYYDRSPDSLRVAAQPADDWRVDRAEDFRRCGDHVAAGMLEKDSAALIRWRHRERAYALAQLETRA